MLEKQEVLDKLVFGFVSSKNEMPANDQYKNASTFVRLAGGAVNLMANCPANMLPADGSFAVFQLERSRSGNTARVLAWGWVNDFANLYSAGEAEIDIEWVKSLGAGGPSSGGGISRQVLQHENGKK